VDWKGIGGGKDEPGQKARDKKKIKRNREPTKEAKECKVHR
jgi:hypothetical protein